MQSQSSLDDLTDWGFVISDEKSKPLVSFGYVDKKKAVEAAKLMKDALDGVIQIMAYG